VQAAFLNGSDSSASGEDGLLQGPGRCPPWPSSSTRRRRRRHCDQARRMAARKAGSQPAGRKLAAARSRGRYRGCQVDAVDEDLKW